MSKLNEFIEKLCPDGVEYKTVSDICNVSRGRVMSKDYLKENEGEYPVFSSQTENNGIFGYIDTYDYDGEYVTWTTDGANAGSIFYHNEKFSITNVCGLLRVNTPYILTKFLYYALSIVSKSYVNSGMGNPKLMSNVMSRIKVPIPPLEIQREIVRILDNFTELIEELTEELTARKQQYEYYKDKLLQIGGNSTCCALKEVCEYSKDRINASEVNEISYIGVDNLLQNKQGKTISSYVPTEGRLIKYVKGDILIGNIRPYLRKIWLADDFGGTNGDVLVIRVKDSTQLLPEYLYYLLSSEDFFNYDAQKSKGAKMPRGDKTAVMEYKIYIPKIEVQYKIIDILDRFNSLCNDLSSGLPAEIEARQKQYQYYRNKLLTFKEKTA